MNNDFDFDNEDLGFEDDELGFDDEFDFDDVEEFETRTVILSKNSMIGLLCLKTSGEGAAICRVDPREGRPSVQVYDDAEKALEWFTKSLRTSTQNGWRLVYDGEPMLG